MDELRGVGGGQVVGIDDADRDDLLQYLEKRRAKGVSARTVNNIRAFGIAFMQWAVKVRRVDRNDLLTVQKTNEQGLRKRIRRSLSVEDCTKLLSASGDRELLYRVALASGLRRRELKLLEWRDVRIDGEHLARPYLGLRPEATKSKRADEVPLSDYIAKQLRAARPALLLPTTPVFKRVPIFRRWKADLRSAGISYHDTEKRIAGFHSLRVTLGTELERIGSPRAIRHWIMRHVDPSVSYSSYVDRERLDAWEVANRLPTYPLPTPLRKTGTDV
jgi:integrase